MNLHNETVINVATLLREPVGSSRSYDVTLDRLRLDDDLVAEAWVGTVKLTRLPDEILAAHHGVAGVRLDCLGCLAEYNQKIEVDFAEEFRIAYDVRTGVGIPGSESDERFEIDANHELDFGEALRQELILAIPMRPTCGPECPGPAIANEEDAEVIDERLAGLAQLLDHDQ